MVINPPFGLIPQLAEMSKRPSNLAMVANTLGDTVQTTMQHMQAQKAKDLESLTTILKNFDLRQPDANQPTQGISMADLVKTYNIKHANKLPPALLGMQAVPKVDAQLLGRIAPALISNQKPGQEIPVMGGILQPGAVPGISPGATVTGHERGTGRSYADKLTSLFGQASTSARATISQRIQQAAADPKSAKVQNFPILDPKVSHTEFIKEFEKEAKLRAIPEEEIKKKVDGFNQDFQRDQKDYLDSLRAAMQKLKTAPSQKKVIKQKLLQAFPLFKSDIDQVAELR